MPFADHPSVNHVHLVGVIYQDPALEVSGRDRLLVLRVRTVDEEGIATGLRVVVADEFLASSLTGKIAKGVVVHLTGELRVDEGGTYVRVTRRRGSDIHPVERMPRVDVGAGRAGQEAGRPPGRVAAPAREAPRPEPQAPAPSPAERRPVQNPPPGATAPPGGGSVRSEPRPSQAAAPQGSVAPPDRPPVPGDQEPPSHPSAGGAGLPGHALGLGRAMRPLPGASRPAAGGISSLKATAPDEDGGRPDEPETSAPTSVAAPLRAPEPSLPPPGSFQRPVATPVPARVVQPAPGTRPGAAVARPPSALPPSPSRQQAPATRQVHNKVSFGPDEIDEQIPL